MLWLKNEGRFGRLLQDLPAVGTVFLEAPLAVDCEWPAGAASHSHSSIVELQTCRMAHTKAAGSQVICRSVHFPGELAAACAVCTPR